ncbi:MAG: AMP-binding protein [Alphaproteobacteria bacterium]|jgi:phenylacetate-CoA ligase|nr:AMP-binding protein [Alphaproteobacteria bacterium]MDP6564414.1 AMP-binding protein [Alphaproteobacteria bacterium]MDP6816348.1 AMP-binding protein [Alphaproteobacteria bacterium]
MVLPLPKNRGELAAWQGRRKLAAVEQARKSAFFQGKLDHIDLARLDDPEEWAKIPTLDKEMLRAIPEDRFFAEFCIGDRRQVAEYWRSGGATGRPLFYPRSFTDIEHAMVAFARSYQMMGLEARDIVHNSFPLGVHPAGQMWARAAAAVGAGVNWVGSGAGTPSAVQLQLLGLMRPSVWIGMPSYGLHLANLAEVEGQNDLFAPIGRILTSAEPLSQAKREKLARMWGAEVFDAFGMTEISLMGCESPAHDGLHIWTDLAYIEVLDETSLEPVPEGQPGTLVTTSLCTNSLTPFLRWNSGDIVSYHETGATDGPFAVFPVIRHAHRTAGFFKIRGVNINHGEFEDFIFADRAVADFKAEAVNQGDLDQLRLSIEVARGADGAALTAALAAGIKRSFEVSPEVVVLERGTLAREFESSIKAPRFVDRRGT